MIELLLKHFSKDGVAYQPSLSEFVDLAVDEEGCFEASAHADILIDIERYNSFLKTPLQLGYLVPCKDGTVLENIGNWDMSKEKDSEDIDYLEWKQYKTALEDCIYEGMEPQKETSWFIDFDLGEPETLSYSKSSKKFCRDNATISDMEGQSITPSFYKQALNII